MASKTNTYIIKMANLRRFKQIDIARKIALRKSGDESNYKLYKGIVNKWFKSDQEPGKEYLLDLAGILNVSVESILRGEDIPNDFGSRATAYSAAKSGNEHIIKQLFNNGECEIIVSDRDEYGKSFIDYVIEFDNYSAFKKAVEYGFCEIHRYGFNIDITSDKNKELSLFKMIIRADDLEMFKKIFDRTSYFINTFDSDCLCDYPFDVLPSNLCGMILNSGAILSWLTEPQPFTNEEFEQENRGVGFKDKEDENLVRTIPTLSAGFNTLLEQAISLKMKNVIDEMINIAFEHIKNVGTIIGNRVSDFTVNDDYILMFKGSHRGNYSYLPYVKNISEIEDKKIAEKAKIINDFVLKLGGKYA